MASVIRMYLILIASACIGRSFDRVADIPVTIPSDDIHDIIQSLPDKDLNYGITGLAYFHKMLYVATNIGLITIDNDKPIVLYQWRNQDPVVDGPWRDYLNNEIWIWHIGSGIMTHYDGYRWINSALPKPSNGDGGDIQVRHLRGVYAIIYVRRTGSSYEPVV